MKIRAGFVSNSSSSSFLIWGIPVSEDDLLVPLEEDQELSEWLESQKIPYWGNDYSTWVGGDPSEMPDDVTMGAWKAQVKENLSKTFKPKVLDSIQWIQEAWFEG